MIDEIIGIIEQEQEIASVVIDVGLNGTDGIDGKSVYEIYRNFTKRKHPRK